MTELEHEIERRRTFAIISHPDAGKTTLTEKFLLYGGAIQTAGSVKGKATAKHAVSDWMELEKQRGISITSSVMQFEYDDPQYVIPDAYLINGEDGLHVQLVDSCTLTIDESYPSLFADTDDAQVRQFLSQCAYQAGRLQSRLFYRNALLQKILLVAAQQQAAYFVGGEKKPLRQKDVAALLGVNVSTISRAIQGKYISVDGRCIRVRELFSRPSAGNRARSTHSIQQQILALIEAEDPQRPLSDQKIHEQLAQSGVAVSRRLIAKYRALAQIPPAYARKITREIQR